MIVTALVFAFLGQTRVQAKIELTDPIKWQNFYDVWKAVLKKHPKIITDEQIGNLYVEWRIQNTGNKNTWENYLKNMKSNDYYYRIVSIPQKDRENISEVTKKELETMTLDTFAKNIRNTSEVTSKNYNDLIENPGTSTLYTTLDECRKYKKKTEPMLWSHVFKAIKDPLELKIRAYATEVASGWYSISRQFIGPANSKKIILEDCVDGKDLPTRRACFGLSVYEE